MNQRVLIRPYVTEKTTRLMEEGTYVFIVGLKASKPQIRRAVEDRYPGVEITGVRTMVIPGKKRRQFTRQGVMQGSTGAYKKAVVSVAPDGRQIDFFESV